MEALRPLPLRAVPHEKIWGSRALEPFDRDRDAGQEPVGELWLTGEDSQVASGPHKGAAVGELVDRFGERLVGSVRAVDSRVRSPYFPILAKLLFVGEKLSVQVHPDDEYALPALDSPGKTEMWYVVSAEPGASVALGLTERLSGERLADAAMSGEIEHYLRWEPVSTGDVIFVPPGLLHTLGPGVVICEIQQNSDITYRFFDFGRLGPDGRPRALHVHDAAAVLVHHDWPGVTPRVSLVGEGLERELLAACPYFAAEMLHWDGELRYRTTPGRFEIVIVLEGSGELDGEPYGPGSCFLIPAEAEPFKVKAAAPTAVIVAYEPDVRRLREEASRAGAQPEAIARALLE